MLATLVAALTALAIAATATIEPSPPAVLEAGLGFVSGTLAGQVTIDVSVRRLPLVPSLTSAVVFISAVAISDIERLGPVMAGAAAMTLITATLRWLGRGQLGRGDVVLSPVLGALVGWLDPWAVGTAWVLTAVSAAVFAVGGLSLGRLGRRSPFPYGPFLVLGSVATMALLVVNTP